MLRNKLLVAVLASTFAAPVFAADDETTVHKEGIHAVPASTYTVTSNVGFVTDYVYRGITQTAHKPAVQGGIDYAHNSGLYAGVWGSNVSWISDSGAVASGSVTMELDTYLGYKGTAPGDVSYDVGAVRYNYLGSYVPAAPFVNADTAELYGAITYKWVTVKYSYSMFDRFLTVPQAAGTSYIDLSANYTLEDSGVSLGAHYGKQAFKGAFADAANPSLSYSDYKLSASKDFGGYVVGLAYTGTNASSIWTYATGGEWGKKVVTLSVLHSM